MRTSNSYGTSLGIKAEHGSALLEHVTHDIVCANIVVDASLDLNRISVRKCLPKSPTDVTALYVLNNIIMPRVLIWV